jgi:hypothetical protein
MDIDLFESAKQHVLDTLPYDRNDLMLSAELQRLTAPDLLIRHYNWMSRHIQAVPRTVQRSKAFTANPIVQQQATDFEKIIADIEDGVDLARYLSKSIKIAIESKTKKLEKRRDLDLMLNDWGVHHLHISTKLEADGFVERGGPLLFGIFQPNSAFLIDVMQHGDWTREHVLRVIVDEWPSEGFVRELAGVRGSRILGSSADYTEEERQRLRAVGISTTIEIDGKIFMPGSGFSTAGTSIKAAFAVKQLLQNLRKFEKFVRNNREQMRLSFAKEGKLYPDNPKFEFLFLQQGYGVIEKRSDTLIILA